MQRQSQSQSHIHNHNHRQAAAASFPLLFADEVEQFEIRAAKEGNRTERDGAWLKERDGLAVGRNGQQGTDNGQRTADIGQKTEDRRPRTVERSFSCPWPWQANVFWPWLPGKSSSCSAPSSESFRQLLSSSSSVRSSPLPLRNNQDAKNEKLFATHTQIFLQFSFYCRLNS